MSRYQIFVSYSHKDSEWLERLQIHLKPVTRSGMIKVWADTEIRPGAKWKEEIEAALNLARVAVLLVTPDFLASDFIAEKELPPLLEAAEKQGLIILWVPVKASLYMRSAVAEYQAAINPSQPLESLSSADVNKKLVEIATKIVEAAGKGSTEPPRFTDRAPMLGRPFLRIQRMGGWYASRVAVSIFIDGAERGKLLPPAPGSPVDFELPSLGEHEVFFKVEGCRSSVYKTPYIGEGQFQTLDVEMPENPFFSFFSRRASFGRMVARPSGITDQRSPR
jgi:hypothetical protein